MCGHAEKRKFIFFSSNLKLKNIKEEEGGRGIGRGGGRGRKRRRRGNESSKILL